MLDLGNVFILGDSYSTFKGYIPDWCAAWYSTDSKPETDVNDVTQTWWKMLIDCTDSELILNSSYSGTTVCHTGYEASDSCKISFVGRMEKLISEGWFEENAIDTFMIFGGTNDSWANSPVGELMYSDWSREDLYSVLPAVCYLLNCVKKLLPKGRIVFILNTELKDIIADNFKIACEYYGVELVELENISKTSGHPNVLGMKQIKEQVLNALK